MSLLAGIGILVPLAVVKTVSDKSKKLRKKKGNDFKIPSKKKTKKVKYNII